MTQDSKYEAVLLDLDGTLLDGNNKIRPRNADVLRSLVDSGVEVMIATGRSTRATLPVVEELGIDSPMLVFNGAGIYCPKEDKLIEERILSNLVMERALAFARERKLLTVVQKAEQKFASPANTHDERRALEFFRGLQILDSHDLPDEYVIRVIYYSADHESGDALQADVEAALDAPLFLTNFPLNLLVTHRDSPLSVVDVHPPSRGKAEGLRFLEEMRGIRPERVIAIGDASNDLDMLEAAGLGVAMGGSSARVQGVADRVIGDHDSDAIADFLQEIFAGRC